MSVRHLRYLMKPRLLLFLVPLIGGLTPFLVGFLNTFLDPHPSDATLLVVGGIIVGLCMISLILPLFRQRLVLVIVLLIGMCVSLGLWVAYSVLPAKPVATEKTFCCHVCREVIKKDQLRLAYYTQDGGQCFGNPPPNAGILTVHDYCRPPERVSLDETRSLVSLAPNHNYVREGPAGLYLYAAISISMATLGFFGFLLIKSSVNKHWFFRA